MPIEIGLQSILTFGFLLAAVAALAYNFLFVLTAELPVVNNATGVVTWEGDQTLFYMKWYYLFGCFWVVQFVFGCEIMTVAGAVSGW